MGFYFKKILIRERQNGGGSELCRQVRKQGLGSVGEEGEEVFTSRSPCLECLLSARYCVRALHGFTHSVPSGALWDWYCYYSHFKDAKAGAQKG